MPGEGSESPRSLLSRKMMSRLVNALVTSSRPIVSSENIWAAELRVEMGSTKLGERYAACCAMLLLILLCLQGHYVPLYVLNI